METRFTSDGWVVPPFLPTAYPVLSVSQALPGAFNVICTSRKGGPF